MASNKLKKNYNAWAIFSIINNVKIKEKTIVGWKIVAGKKITTDLTIKIIKKFNGEILLSPVSSYSRKVLEQIVTSTNKLNIFFPEDMVLFQSDVKDFNERGITILIPDMIAQLDRRQYLRYQVDEKISVDATFIKNRPGMSNKVQKFKKNCFDISAGGISFYVSKTEYAFFRNGDVIEKIVIMIEKNQIVTSASVVNIFQIDPNDRNGLYYKSWKVCLKFDKIHENSIRKINEFVFQHVDFVEDVI